MSIPLIDFLPQFRRRPGAYVLRGSYLATCAFLDGYEAGLQEHALVDFRSWLLRRGKGRPELAWQYLVLSEIYEDREWPDIRDFRAEEDDRAISVLFALLEDFFEERKAS